MSRTTKWEHQSDPIRSIWHDERKARPAGRHAKAFADDLALDADEPAADTFRKVCRDLGYRGPWIATDDAPAEPGLVAA